MKKKVLKFVCFVILFLMFSINQVSLPKTENNFLNIVSAEETTEVDGDTKLTESDWKIELDENAKGGTKEFDFIQRNLASSDLADNGHFLLITGIVLISLAVISLAFFSFCLYKLCRNTKKRPQKRGTRCK